MNLFTAEISICPSYFLAPHWILPCVCSPSSFCLAVYAYLVTHLHADLCLLWICWWFSSFFSIWDYNSVYFASLKISYCGIFFLFQGVMLPWILLFCYFNLLCFCIGICRSGRGLWAEPAAVTLRYSFSDTRLRWTTSHWPVIPRFQLSPLRTGKPHRCDNQCLQNTSIFCPLSLWLSANYTPIDNHLIPFVEPS